MRYKLRKDDLVQVIAGNDKHRSGQASEAAGRGRIISVDRKNGMVIVEGISTRTFHTKVRKTEKGGEEGGIEQREAAIPISNVMLVDPETDKPVRVGIKEQDGKKVRYTKGRNASGTILDDHA